MDSRKLILILVLTLFITLLQLPAVQAATGGVVQTFVIDGTNYTIHTFIANGTFETSTTITNATILVVAGGGGGGAPNGGGGGGGGALVTYGYDITANANVVVGAGGYEAAGAGQANDGKNSSFGSLIAIGGGGGADGYVLAGHYGGSGGGGGVSGSDSGAGGSSVSGQGNNGGANSPTGDFCSGGGGGSYSAGSAATSSAGGNGGTGLTINLNGTTAYYSGGGGGTCYSGTDVGTGGAGGGTAGVAGSTAGINSPANSGGGAGGSKDGTAATGGSGIVIVKYKTDQAAPAAPAPTLTSTYISPGVKTMAYDWSNLSCYATANGANATIWYVYEWYNNSVFYKNGTKAGVNNTELLVDTLLATETTMGETWMCKVKATLYNTSFSSSLNGTKFIEGIRFNSSTPLNISFGNLFDDYLNTSYNFYDTSATNFQLWHTTNSSYSPYSVCINGTCYSGWSNRSSYYNTTSWVEFELSESEIYPGTYNMPQTLIQTIPHNVSATVTEPKHYLSVEFLNFSTNTNYNVLEFMMNVTTGTKAMRIYYCNSSYNFASKVHESENCVNIGSQLATTPYNHSHSQYSSHMVFIVPLNVTTGKVNGIKATSKSYFMFRGDAGTTWTMYGVTNIVRNGVLRKSTNDGTAWTNQTFTPDTHIHQFYNDSIYYEYACFNESGDSNAPVCSAIKADALDVGVLPPSSPVVFPPLNQSYGGRIYINWTPAVSQTGQTIFSYNVTLSGATDYTIGNYTGNTTSTNICSKNYANGGYQAVVKATDNALQTSIGESESFYIYYLLNVSQNTPTDGASINNPVVNFSCSALEGTSDTDMGNITLKIYQSDVLVNSRTAYTNGNNYQANWSVMMTEGSFTWECVLETFDCYDTATSGNRSLFVDGIPPVITINAPSNHTAYQSPTANYLVSLDYVVSDIALDRCWYSYDNQGITDLPGCINTTYNTITYGLHNVTLYSNDTSNNAANKTSFFSVGVLTTDAKNATIRTGYDVNLTYNFGTGVTAICNAETNSTATKGVLCSLFGTTQIRCSSYPDTDGTYSFRARCNDSNGYSWYSDNYTWYVDTVNPILNSTTFSDNRTYSRGSRLVGMWNFTDTNIFRVNATIDGYLVYDISRLQYLSVGGTAVFQENNINANNYSLVVSFNTSNLTNGRHNLSVQVWDSHTASQIAEYGVVKTILSTELEYNTGKNKIKITAADEPLKLINPFTTEKKKDRYTFDYKPSAEKDRYTFNVETESELYVVNNPSMKYKTWIVSGGNWLDFYVENRPDIEISINKTSKTTAVVTIKSVAKEAKTAIQYVKDEKGKTTEKVVVVEQAITKQKLTDTDGKIKFSSIGDLNVLELDYSFYIYTATIYYLPIVSETQMQSVSLVLNTSGANMTPEVTLNINGTTQENITQTGSYDTLIVFNKSFYTPQVVSTQDVSSYWRFNFSGVTPVSDNYQINFSQVVNDIGLTTNCSEPNATAAITFFGLDEESELPITYDLGIDADIWISDMSLSINTHFDFTGGNNYTLCVKPATAIYNIYSVMEYVADGYADRKYYLYNTTISGAAPQDVNLYLLNLTTGGSTINNLFQIVNSQTGIPIANAYIKFYRYYPGQNELKLVEVEKTDANGRTIAKLVLYDVFYQYSVDYPYGVNRLVTDTAKATQQTTTLAIALGSDLMSNFAIVADTYTDVVCDSTTQTCEVDWVSTSGTNRVVKLLVYESTGVSRQLISTQTSSALPGGKLFYTVSPFKNNTNYEAEGYIVTGTGDSLADTANMIDEQNVFSQNQPLRVASLLPLILLTISIICALLDLGTVGVVIGSMSGIIIGMVFTIIPLNVGGIVSLLVLAFILIYKMVK